MKRTTDMTINGFPISTNSDSTRAGTRAAVRPRKSISAPSETKKKSSRKSRNGASREPIASR